MSTFRGHAKSLSAGYVYYQRLLTDRGEDGQLFYPKLGKYVQNASNRILSQTQKYSTEASGVRAQAQAEFAKERALLQEKFGVNLGFDYYRGGADFKEIIDALNACLNLKEIYERNVQLIKNTDMKGVFSWYPTYFLHAWEEKWPTIKQEFYDNFAQRMEAADALSLVLDKYLPEICVDGISKMLNGPEVEHASIDENLKGAYAALLDHIGSIQNAGDMANQIYRAYQLDELKEELLKTLKTDNGKIDGRAIKPKVKSMITKNIHTRGGLSLEAIESAIFQMVASGIEGGSTIHSGATGIKADNILTISIDTGVVEDFLAQAQGNRDSNIQALSELGRKLSKLNDGFIVYSSDKNYTLNNKFGGFGAGSLGVNAESFLSKLPMVESSVSTLIGAIQQLGDGAMLAHQEAAFEAMLAQDVAYMLFDDYTTIGDTGSGGKAIHVMNLNGIMMPLSVVLSLLADAIEMIDDEAIRSIVSVDIKAPDILWKTQDDQEKAYPNNGAAAWEHQRQFALDNTKITAKFLKDFKSLISSLM